jgi:hypothetical protein
LNRINQNKSDENIEKDENLRKDKLKEIMKEK